MPAIYANSPAVKPRIQLSSTFPTLVTTNGSGTASASGTTLSLGLPASTISGDGGRASCVFTVSDYVDPCNFRAYVRLVSHTATSSAFHGFYLRNSSVNNEIRYWATAGGSLYFGFLGGSWSGNLAVGVGAVAYDGTYWLEMTVTGSNLQLRYGRASGSVPPTWGDADWRLLWSGSLYPLYWNTLSPPFDQIGAFLTTYDPASPDAISASMADMTLELL